PSQGELTIDIADQVVEQIKISDLLGRVISLIDTESKQSISLDLTHLEKGIYMLSFYDRKDRFLGIRKIVISDP
ncbi:MAG: T9SS type A sorting domain-containing protein, partial [Bacteroidia bacterium]|nr:T9SS type A sorting domain-containing protein [Bacteroidia bacterium]